MPIKLEITHLFDQVEIPEDEMESLLGVASWQSEPQFPYPGRSAWHVFKKPVYLKNDKEKIFRAAKLKGVGVWNPENFHLYSGVHGMAYCYKPIQPTTEDYKFTSSIAHFGFTDEGFFEAVYSEPAPYGGILHRRAVQEYENSLRMLAHGVPAQVSLLVARLPASYKFMDEDMGIVISLSEEIEPFRLHLIHFGDHELFEQELKYYTRLQKSIGLPENIQDENIRLQTINALSGQIGKLLHDFSAAGLYRHSGGWEDLSFCLKNKRVFLADLDSNRCMAELTACTRPLQILRDLSSSIHKLLNMFYYPTVLDKYTFSNLVASDPVSEMLSAYFPASNAGKIKKVAARFWDYFAPHFFLMQRWVHGNCQGEVVDEGVVRAKPAQHPNIFPSITRIPNGPQRYRNRVLGEREPEIRKSYKMDDEIFFTLSMLNLFPLYSESDLYSFFPTDCTLGDLEERAQAFLGEKYHYVSYLLSDR